jgi:AcrR family transcriptional regulator
MGATSGEAAALVRPGRQRSDACDAAILASTLRLLGEQGYSGLTVAAVIDDAGVSSATLYRRWPTKQDLVAAAVATMVPEPANTDTGSLAGDLEAFVQHVARSIAARREDIADALSLEKKRNPELAAVLRARFLEPRLAELRAMFTRAKRRGEVRTLPAPDVVLSLVAGPLYHRSFNLGEPLSPAFVRAVVKHAVQAFLA